jgi:SH3-like domain-containing protein
MSLRLWCVAILSVMPLFFSEAFADDEQDLSGLPVPRFVSLRSGDVNMRAGPGTRYIINWVYKREGLPVEIIEEFDQWRQIRDSEGTVGWVHKQMLQGKRTAVIVRGIGVLRRTPEDHAGAILRAEPGVTGRLLECERDWCRMQISGRKGWIDKAHIWGVYPKEEF